MVRYVAATVDSLIETNMAATAASKSNTADVTPNPPKALFLAAKFMRSNMLFLTLMLVVWPETSMFWARISSITGSRRPPMREQM